MSIFHSSFEEPFGEEIEGVLLAMDTENMLNVRGAAAVEIVEHFKLVGVGAQSGDFINFRFEQQRRAEDFDFLAMLCDSAAKCIFGHIADNQNDVFRVGYIIL